MSEVFQNAINALVNALNQFHPVSKTTIEILSKNCELEKFDKGQYLLRRGEVCTSYYFVYEGLIRSFIREEDKEITTWLACAGDLVTSIHSMRSSSPCIESIQTLRKCNLLRLDAKHLEKVYKTDPEFNQTSRKLLEYYYGEAEVRALIARMPTAELKYKLFLEKHPQFVNLIPQKYIASYLGIRQETLSRLIGAKI